MLIRAIVCASARVGRRLLRLAPRTGVRWSKVPPRSDVAGHLATSPCDVVLLEETAGSRGLDETVRTLRGRNAPPEIIILSEREDAERRAALLAAGAMAVVHLGLGDDPLAALLDSLLGRCRELQEDRRLARRAQGRFSFEDFALTSPAMRDLIAVVRRVVDVDSSLLVLGETGVGKEYLARVIHAEGPRRRGPFVSVNCGALPEGLIEGELFGHEEGAFTGATHARRGYFELAHGGTLFLDEIGELPVHLQVKLLRVLQDGRIQPVGGEQELEVDVRVIAATNRDLASEVEDRRFRADLFFRLNVVTLTVPPLRARREDIPALIRTHVRMFAERFRRPEPEIDAEAMAALVSYGWPGNVRELINVIERSVLLCEGGRIAASHLPDAIAHGPYAGRPAEAKCASGTSRQSELFEMPLHEASTRVLQAFERDYLLRLLDVCGGRVGEAARRAGLSPRGLYGKLRRLGLAGGRNVVAAE